jgi:hypothetical protein
MTPRLTRAGQCEFFAGVPRLRFIFALLLATLWLPATLHCALEEAGMIGTAACDTGDTEHCVQDNCATVEATHYRTSDILVTVTAPTLLVCLGLSEAIPAEAIIVPLVSPERSDCPLEVPRTWHFVVRAALPARAPSFLA